MSQPDSVDDRIDEGDKAKFKPFGHPITANEIHAVGLGLLGLFLGLTYSVGYTRLAIFTSLFLLAGAIGIKGLLGDKFKRLSTIAVETKRHEPWWFIGSFIINFILGTHLPSILG